MASKEEELQELADLEQLERLEAEERASSPVQTKKGIQPSNWRTGTPASPIDEEVNPGQTLLEGVGSGLVRTGRGVTNLLGKALRNSALMGAAGRPKDPNAMLPDWATDEAIKEQDELDKPLAKSDMGSLGQTAGSVAAALPMAVPARAPATAQATSSVLARTLGGPTARSALEGSIQGAVTGDPEHQGQSALKGALLSGALTKAGQTGKRLTSGLGKTSEAADHLEQFAEQHGKDVFIPAAQAISDDADLPSRLVKTLYKEVLPMVPGASAQIKSQGKRLAGDVREIALKEADLKGTLNADDLSKPEQAIPKLQKALDDEYLDTVKSYSFRVPPKFRDDVKAKIKAASPDVDDVTLNKISTMIDEKVSRYASNKSSLVGENLLNAKNAISDEIRGLRGAEKRAGVAGIQAIEDMVVHRLSLGNSPIMKADLARYQSLAEPYAAFVAVRDATKKAVVKKGEFSPAQLTRSAKKAPVQRMLGQTADEVMSQSLGAPSPAGRVAAYTALGGLGFLGGPLAVGGAIGGGNALATELAQDIIMGRSGPQQALIEALRKNPKKAKYAGFLPRMAAAPNSGEE